MPFNMLQYEDWSERKRFQEKPKIKKQEELQGTVFTKEELRELREGENLPIRDLYVRPGGVRRIRELRKKAERILGPEKVKELPGKEPQGVSSQESGEQRSLYSNKHNFIMPNGNIEKGPQGPKIGAEEGIDINAGEKINIDTGEVIEEKSGVTMEGESEIKQEGEAVETPEKSLQEQGEVSDFEAKFAERYQELARRKQALTKLIDEMKNSFKVNKIAELPVVLQTDIQQKQAEFNVVADKLEREKEGARLGHWSREIKGI